MKITKVEAMGIRCPEPNDLGNIRNTTLVKVETDEGLVGWGEGITMWPEATHAVVSLINNGLHELLTGCDPLETERLWTNMKSHVWWYGEGGLASFAISAIDIALWDIKGKALGVPLYQLLGGKFWDRLPTTASIHVKYATHEENADEIASYIEEGYQSIKVGWGKKGLAKLGQNAQYDLDYVKTVRDRIGMDKGFIIDIGNNIKWDVAHAIRMTRSFEEYNIMFIEEPFHPSRIDDYKELRAATSLQIGAGEREWTVDAYSRLLKTGTLDIIGIDPARVEGITAFLKIIQMVAAEKRKFNAHAWSTGITSAASLHLSISSPHCFMFELKPLSNPMQSELIENPIEPREGWAYAPKGPGLGVDVNQKALAKYRFV